MSTPTPSSGLPPFDQYRAEHGDGEACPDEPHWCGDQQPAPRTVTAEQIAEVLALHPAAAMPGTCGCGAAHPKNGGGYNGGLYYDRRNWHREHQAERVAALGITVETTP